MRHMRFAAGTKARRQVSAVASVLAATAAFIFATGDAHAVMRGSSAGGISKHVVKLVGHNLLCTAVVIGRQTLLTANHTNIFFIQIEFIITYLRNKNIYQLYYIMLIIIIDI